VCERSELDEVGDRLDAAEALEVQALADYDRVARELDRSRDEAARSLVSEVGKLLGQLNMTGTRLEYRWRPRPDASSPLIREGFSVAFDELGVEECELLVAPNPGEEPKPMSRVASGGELSRIHLAIRTALIGRSAGGGRTLLFDEVDSGLGGAAAAALARLLAGLAVDDQVLVVTHLPQVAAGASNHWKVEKVMDDGRAVTRAAALDLQQREHEIARMLAGDRVTPSARDHARALLENR
jgi:DNA repair protein RecN (Recombination protein N)